MVPRSRVIKAGAGPVGHRRERDGVKRDVYSGAEGQGVSLVLGACDRMNAIGRAERAARVASIAWRKRALPSAWVKSCVPALFLVVVGTLAFAAAPAFAAPKAPEAPEVAVETPVRATEATVHGVLNPGKVGEPGTYEMETYEFLYKASKAGVCEGGSVAPAPPGVSLGGGKEEVSEVLPALSAGTEYAVCLEVEGAGGRTVSTPTTFKTAVPPEKPDTTSPAKSITARTAILEGILNPTAAAEVGWHFLYSTEASCSSNPSETTPVAVAEVPAKTKVHTEVKELQPHHKYEFCLVASNEAGEMADSGTEASFETKAAAPTVESESTSGVTSSTSNLEAQVNPNNENTTAHLQYSTSPAVNGSGALTTPTALAGSELGEGYGAQPVGNGSLTGLPAAATFYYQVVATNVTGTTYGAVQSFTTVPAPTTAEVSAITATTATFNGNLTPLNATVATEYSFSYRAGDECTGESATGTESAGTGSAPKTVSAEVTGLSPNTQYTVCLLASNASGSTQAQPVTFTTAVAAPKIESESTADVDATEARLEASLSSGNSPTAYHFEYGTVAGSYEHSVPVPDGQIPAKLTAVVVNNVVTGLTPATTYHYRLVAANALPPAVDGPDQTFTTSAAPTSPPGSCPNERLREEQPYGLGLPDCRAYEMVSPANTNGQDAASDFPESAPRASEAPEGAEPALTYSAKGAFGDPEGALVNNQYLSRRTPEGWSTQAITPLSSPGKKPTEPHETAYPTTYFTPELTAGLALTSATLSEFPIITGEGLRVYLAQFSGPVYQYVGLDGIKQEAPWGASANLERVVLTNLENSSLLEWVDGTDFPVSVTNESEEMPASAGSTEEFAHEKDAWHATSEDGKRVYFTTPPTTSSIGQLYVRVNIGEKQSELGPKGECLEPEMACTIEVSASQRQPEDPAGAQEARYWGASADGDRAFFTSSSELTQDAYTGTADNAPNLYEYDLASGKLTDLTGEETDASGEGAAVQGVAQISEGGAYVYFVANGVLTNVANASGEHAEQGNCDPEGSGVSCNLYVSHEGGEPVFIAKLAQKDETDWLNGNRPESGPEINTAVVSPAGSRLAFISEQSLPAAGFPDGYDNEQAQPRECETELESHELESGKCREVYLYDAETNALACASCNPSGARPEGPSTLSGVVPHYQAFADYRPRALLEDGDLFFDSKDALAQGSSGGRENVYEYESGAVHAISNVAGGYGGFFLDASPNGENVFFASADRLLPEDPGGNTVVWDAHVDGGFPVATTTVPCANAETCEPPPSPASTPGAPASATFSGPGNLAPASPAPTKPKAVVETRAQKLAKALKACRKDKTKKKRLACERTARKKYGPSKPKNAGNERRTSR